MIKFTVFVAVVTLWAAFPADSDAGNHCRGCLRIGVVAPVVIQPVPVQPVIVAPQPIAIQPVVPVRRYYATPLRDLLFGRYQYVPVAPGCCNETQPTPAEPVQPLPEDGASVQPVKG